MRSVGALVSAVLVGLVSCGGAPKGPTDDNGGPAYASLLTATATTSAEAAENRIAMGGVIKTMFVIFFENANWSEVKGNSSAPYLNDTLLPIAAHTEQYFDNPKGVHPSEPNYIWTEAGDNLGILDDDEPSVNHRSTRMHLVSLLDAAGIPWTSYQENITGIGCPTVNGNLYAPRHDPAVYFDDVRNDTAYCQKHVRPYLELAGDLAAGRVSGYVFITPNLCDDMHNTLGCKTTDAFVNGDAWMAAQVPMIMASEAYQSGAIFMTWDESEQGEYPIGMIVLSPFVRPGYSSNTHFTQSSLLRTSQTIFGVRPYLRDAANVEDLGELFTQFP